MECAICMEVVHPMCVTDYGVEGFIKMDQPNSWECPRCIKAIEDKKAKAIDEVDTAVKTETNSSETNGQPLPAKLPKLEPPEPIDPLRRPISSGSDANVAGAYQLFSVSFPDLIDVFRVKATFDSLSCYAFRFENYIS